MFRPPTPVPLASVGGSGGTSIVNNNSSVAVNVDSSTGQSVIQITTNNKAALTVDNDQYVIIGNKTGIIPTKRLTIVDPSGQGIQIINSLAASSVSLVTNQSGGLSINTSGSHVQFGSNNLYIGQGSLYIGSSAVLSTAEQLNYTATTKGVAEQSKALIVNESRDIGNINSLVASILTGVLQTPYQPNINSLNEVNISSLSLRGDAIQSTAGELNYLKGVTQGIASQSSAIVLDNQKNIGGINSILANTLAGTILTSSQPNITSIGALETLVVNQYIGIGTNAPTRTLDIVSDSPTIRLSNRSTSAEILVDGLGNLRLNPDSNVYIKTHANIIFAGSSEILGLSNITSTSITGVVATRAQPNITSVGVLSSLSVNGDVVIGAFDSASSRRLLVNEAEGHCIRICQSPTIGCDINVTTMGDLELIPTRDVKIAGGKAIRLSGPITGVTDLVATSLTGLILTSSQPNITSIGVLSNLNVLNTIDTNSINATIVSGTLTTGSQPNITTIGTLSNLNVSNAITTGTLSANSLTGTLLTPAQPNITSLGTLLGLNVSNGITSGSLTADTISGVLLTASQPNITSIGNLSNLNVSYGITASTVTSNTLSGQILTPDQPLITSIGTLHSLNVINTITTATVNAVDITGKLLSPNQSNITTVGTLTSLSVRDDISAQSISSNTLTGTLLTSAQPNINAIGTLSRLQLNGLFGIGVAVPSSVIDINTSNINTEASIKLNNGTTSIEFSVGTDGIYLDTSGSFLTLGTGVGLRFTGGGIAGLSNLTAAELAGTITTSNQPNITTVGTLNYLDTAYLGVGITHSDQYRINIFDTDGKIAMVSNGSQSLACYIANGDYTLNASNNRIALGSDVSLVLNGGTIINLDHLSTNTIGGVLVTPSQPNITSLGNLDNLTVNGPIAALDAAFDNVIVDGDITIKGNLNLSSSLSFANLSSSNAIFNSNLPALSVSDGGTLTVIGGASFSRNVIIGESLKIGNITLTENSFSGMVSGAEGIVEASKTIVADSSRNLTGFNNLIATNVFGSLATQYQPNITTVGNLTNLNVDGYLGLGTSSPMKQFEVNSINGDCMRLSYDKTTRPASYVDFSVDEFGSGSISPSGPTLTLKTRVVTDKITLGNTTSSIMPLEIGWAPFVMTQPYAYNSSANGKGIINPATSGFISYNYSVRAYGRILCTQSLDVMSDKRTKKNITQLTDEYCTSFVERTTPVSFNWINGDDNKSFGYIAQELVRTGFNDLVNMAHDPSVEEVIDEDGFINPKGVKFTISYQHIIPILAKNQKRLIQENQELRAKLDAIIELLHSMKQN